MSQRTQRVDELLRQEITAILAKDVADPEIGFATVTDVETSADLRHARVWVSVIGREVERSTTLGALERAMVFVRRELGTRLRLKRIPELHVRLDDSAERGTRVLRLLSDLEEGRAPEPAPAGESLPTPVAWLGREGDAVETGQSGSEPGPQSAAPEPVPAFAQPRRRARRTRAAHRGRHQTDPRR